MMSWEELIEWAKTERKSMFRKVIGVNYAKLGNGCDIWDAHYPDSPLLVKVTDEHLHPSGFMESIHDGLLDTYWGAEALPEQLEDDVHVAWIDGPTYYLDGRREVDSWEFILD